MLGYHPQVILAGRRINDGMGKYIAEQTVKQMIAAGSQVKGARVNVLGLTFKEELRRPAQQQGRRHHRGAARPTASRSSCTTRRPTPRRRSREYGVRLSSWDDCRAPTPSSPPWRMRATSRWASRQICEKVVPDGCFVDVKAGFDAAALKAAGLRVWRL